MRVEDVRIGQSYFVRQKRRQIVVRLIEIRPYHPHYVLVTESGELIKVSSAACLSKNIGMDVSSRDSIIRAKSSHSESGEGE
jgi:hypothetical protein